jgi:hypothetical protein
MKIKVKIEGEVDIREIEDIFEGLDTTKIDVLKSKKLQKLPEIQQIIERVKRENEDMLKREIVLQELVILKNGTYRLSGEIIIA